MFLTWFILNRLCRWGYITGSKVFCDVSSLINPCRVDPFTFGNVFCYNLNLIHLFTRHRRWGYITGSKVFYDVISLFHLCRVKPISTGNVFSNNLNLISLCKVRQTSGCNAFGNTIFQTFFVMYEALLTVWITLISSVSIHKGNPIKNKYTNTLIDRLRLNYRDDQVNKVPIPRLFWK